MRRSSKTNTILLAAVLTVFVLVLLRQLSVGTLHLDPVAYELVDVNKTADSVSPVVSPCPTGTVSGLTFPVCTFTAEEDGQVSQMFLSNQYWDESFVARIVATLRSLKTTNDSQRLVMFVDVGAFIGAYSLAAAHAGIPVIAVEINWEAIGRLSKSIVAGNIQDRIHVLHNAVLNQTGQSIDVDYRLKNPGGSHVRSSSICLEQLQTASNSRCLSSVARTITLNDVLPLIKRIGQKSDLSLKPKIVMKVDIESKELEVFTESSAADFFDAVDVEGVQMEWVVFRRDRDDPAGRNATDALVQFFIRRGYKFHPVGAVELQKNILDSKEWLSWKDSDVWISKDS